MKHMDEREAAWREDLAKIQEELAAKVQEWRIKGICVTAKGIPDMTEEEAARYVDYILERVPDPVTWIDIRPEKGDKVDLHYEFQTVKFERIRRITGYLVGTIGRWNNAKRAEESQRVKHA